MARTCLAVFDFDRTVVLDDSDATIINKLKENKPPPEWEATNKDWTPYMSDVFEHAFTAGLSQDDILSCIGAMRPTPGIEQLITTLATEGWDVLVLTDANTVFVQHWLKVHGLSDCITSVITNKAFFSSGRLYIEPCMRQTACARCPTNLCKSIALLRWCQQHQYQRIVYSGDGRNDYCPATNLPANATVFPRSGYPMDELIKKTLSSSSPQIKAKVVPWHDAYTILHELFPEKAHIH
ncbi:pyridoxal phosphate phosphatase PHOSPHO2-like [Anticarsia gemmatalis]|uniref:pyridoxal phosphate phosphatase PHOSPHO2-like n=1 Tax=Anticarsia gemmatalis TaxID=129554 RepID=UPI003F7632DB